MLLLLIKMIGAVSLLIWGTHTVKTAMLNTFGDKLRSLMAQHLRNRLYGYLSGCLTAMMLQSSTATALLVSGLQSEGVVSTAIALSCVLGADLGSAVMVRVLSLDLSAVSPVLMAVGIALKLSRPGTKKGDFGMILLGLGFIMTALSMILSTTAPIKSSQAVVDFFAWIADSPLYSLGGGLLLALLCFSSLAVVVIVAGLVAGGVLTIDAGLWFAVGADFGSAFLALITTAAASPVARRGPIGNFVFRLFGVLFFSVLLATTNWGPQFFGRFDAGVIWFHITFNLTIGLTGLFFIGPMSGFLHRLLPASDSTSDVILLLKADHLLDPNHSLTLSRRELVKSIQMLHTFWTSIPGLLTSTPTDDDIDHLRRLTEQVNRRSHAISQFLSAIMNKGLNYEQLVEWQRQKNNNAGLRLTINSTNSILTALETKRDRADLQFSLEGSQELLTQQQRILNNLELVITLFETSDFEERRRLREQLRMEKKAMEREEFEFVEHHMNRLTGEEVKSVKTHALHMELLTLFLRFNSLICICDEQ